MDPGTIATYREPVLLMAPLHAPTQASLEERYDVHRFWCAEDPSALLVRLAPSCRVVVTGGSRGIDATTMAALPRLQLVSSFGVGVDAIDLNHARQRGIVVTNTPDVLTEDVADLAIALLLASIRRIPQADRFVREGRWAQAAFGLTPSLQRRRVGIIGLGRIGLAIAQRCAAFNTDVRWYGPRPKPDCAFYRHNDPVELADWADILIAACPGGPDTRGIVSRGVLQALGPQGVFVNIARGSVVDESALIDLLSSGKLGGAGLDVFDNEPRIDPRFFGLDNVVLHPHQGSATHSTRAAMGDLVLKNVAAWLAGDPVLTPVF